MDEAKLQEFMGQLVTDMGGAAMIANVSIDGLKLDASDAKWPAIEMTTISRRVYYQEIRVRDWRWLWLRRKTVTKLLDL